MEQQVLAYTKPDRYGAIWFTATNLELPPPDFDAMLHISIQHFRQEYQNTKQKFPDRRVRPTAFWFDVPVGTQQIYINVLTKQGFGCYASTPQKTRYLLRNEANVPVMGMASLGANAIVTRVSKGDTEVLLVLGLRDPYLRLPGGNVEPGELTETALSRELYEELGVHAKIGKCVGFEERIKGLCYEEDDIRVTHVLFFYRATLPDPDMTLLLQPSELKASQWIKLSLLLRDTEFDVTYADGTGGKHKVNTLTQAAIGLLAGIEVSRSSDGARKLHTIV
jgi:ADP-ribose pyrophosphatase YjhB (NUDIX family)